MAIELLADEKIDTLFKGYLADLGREYRGSFFQEEDTTNVLTCEYQKLCVTYSTQVTRRILLMIENLQISPMEGLNPGNYVPVQSLYRE